VLYGYDRIKSSFKAKANSDRTAMVAGSSGMHWEVGVAMQADVARNALGRNIRKLWNNLLSCSTRLEMWLGGQGVQTFFLEGLQTQSMSYSDNTINANQCSLASTVLRQNIPRL
jgi:hypothetical protein